MKKRGSHHVEVILSFIIFLGAVGFALWFFSPDGGVRRADSSMEYVFREVNRNASIDLISYSVKINPTWVSGLTPEIIGFEVNGIDSEMFGRARTEDGSVLGINREGDEFYVKNFDWDGTSLIYLDFSKFFSDDNLIDSSVGVVEDYYDLGSKEKSEVLEESKIHDLQSRYFSNYSLLREDFNVYVDFGFNIVFDDGERIDVEKQIPQGLDVFSETRRVKVLRENGNVEFADMIVKVW